MTQIGKTLFWGLDDAIWPKNKKSRVLDFDHVAVSNQFSKCHAIPTSSLEFGLLLHVLHLMLPTFDK